MAMSTVQEKPSALKREYPARQKRIINFFLLLWVIFALLDPDPDRVRSVVVKEFHTKAGAGGANSTWCICPSCEYFPPIPVLFIE